MIWKIKIFLNWIKFYIKIAWKKLNWNFMKIIQFGITWKYMSENWVQPFDIKLYKN